MTGLRVAVAVGALCVGSLLSLSVPARACSVLAPTGVTWVEVVAAHANGPIVLMARCYGGAACLTPSSLRVEQFAGAWSVAGSFEIKPIPDSSEQLVFFRPMAALDPGASYTVWVEKLWATFRLAAAGDAAPLARITSQPSSRIEPAGQPYSCEYIIEPVGCGFWGGPLPKSSLVWRAGGRLQPTLEVHVPANDGWLFRSYHESPPRGGFSWSTSEVRAIDLSFDAERCLVVEGWNVLRDVRETRKVCATAPPAIGAEQTVTVPRQNLGTCTQLPVRGDSFQQATELLETYCVDRRAYCATRTTGPTRCGALDPRCTPESTDAGADAGAVADAGAPAEDDSTQDTGSAEADHGSDEMSEEDMQAMADENGCSLGHPRQHAWVLALALLARVRRRKRAAT